MSPRRGGWLIFATLLAAMLASVMHLPASVPDWAGHLRPDWTIAVLFYWGFAASERTGLVEAWLLGFVVDVLVGDPLGLNGACMAGAVFSGHILHERIRLYTALQRAGIAFVVLLLAALVREVARVLALGTTPSFWFLAAPGVTALLFPLVALGLAALRRRFPVR